MERLITPRELAELLGLKLSTIYALSHRRRIPTVKLSRSTLRFRVADVEKLVKAGLRPALRPLHPQDPSDGEGGGR